MTDLQPGPAGFKAPDNFFTMPDAVEWHLLYDHELDAIASPGSGVYGSVGFTFLGGAIGLSQSAYALYSKEIKDHTQQDLIGGFVCLICFALSICCLLIWASSKYKNAGVVSRIRKRPKYKMPSGNLYNPP